MIWLATLTTTILCWNARLAYAFTITTRPDNILHTRQLDRSRYGQQQQKQQQDSCWIPSRSGRQFSVSPLAAVGKTGGRVIATSEEFEQVVLKKKNVNDETENDDSDNNRPVMVFFTAPWCGPCRLSIPVVKEISKEYANQMQTVEVCTDDLPAIASDANVVSIPTIQIYHQGQVLDTIVGCVAKSVLATAVEKVLEDVTAV